MKNGNDDKDNKDKEKRLILKAFALLTQLGLSMACCVAIGLFAGKFLDDRLGTAPVLMLVFVFLGAAAAIKLIYDIIKDWK